MGQTNGRCICYNYFRAKGFHYVKGTSCMYNLVLIVVLNKATQQLARAKMHMYVLFFCKENFLGTRFMMSRENSLKIYIKTYSIL